MLFKHAARGDERAFGTYMCVDAASITTGYAAAICAASASFNGTNVIKPASGTATTLPGFIGVATQDIAANAYGTIQVYGPVASVFLSNTNTSVTINIGDPLVPGAVAGGLWSVAPTYANSGFCFVIASNVPLTTSNAATASYLSGFIRHGL